jgi:hypothetical protein
MSRRIQLSMTAVVFVGLLAAGGPAAGATAGLRGPLKDVVAAGPGDAWAVGRGTIVHWDGAAWTPTPWVTPLSPQYAAIDASGSDDVWAVGRVTRYDVWRPLIVHWTGTAWRHARMPSIPGEVSLNDVAAVSLDEAWAVGRAVTFPVASGSPERERPVVLMWDGASWTRVAVPGTGRLDAVARVGTGTLWVAGRTETGQPVLLRRRGDGTWRTFPVAEAAGTDCRITDLDRHQAVGWCTDGIHVTPYAARFSADGIEPQDVGGRGRLMSVDVAAITLGGGTDGDGHARLWRRSNETQTWRRGSFPTPATGRSGLLGVSVRTGSDAWAVGWRVVGGVVRPFAAHWDGSGWTVTPI